MHDFGVKSGAVKQKLSVLSNKYFLKEFESVKGVGSSVWVSFCSLCMAKVIYNEFVFHFLGLLVAK